MQNGGQATAAAPAKEGESDASSHKLSKVLGGKDDEDAKEPDIAHELSSSEVFLLHKRIKYASVSCVTLRSNILCIHCRMRFQLVHGCSTWGRGRAGGKAQLCWSCRPRS